MIYVFLMICVYLMLGVFVFLIGLEMHKEAYPDKYLTDRQIKLMMLIVTLFWLPLLFCIAFEMLFCGKEKKC